MNSDQIQLEPGWKKELIAEFEKPYMAKLRQFLVIQKQNQKKIFPKGGEIFAAFNTTPFDSVRVVVIGQDPYHGVGQANGLAFSVPKGVSLPPSLVNIFREIDYEFGANSLALRASNGCLKKWSKQGVLLLNSVLTVEEGKAGSHQGKGWELFTDKVVRILDESPSPLVFMLWGAYAQKKAAFVNKDRHCVLVSSHPSPLSAHRGFIGCNHFKVANQFLERNGDKPIDWLDIP